MEDFFEEFQFTIGVIVGLLIAALIFWMEILFY